MKTVLMWGDPPHSPRGKQRGAPPWREWLDVIAELKEHAGHWGVVAVTDCIADATNPANALRYVPGVEVATRKLNGGHGYVYARYIGTEEQS